MDIKTRSSDLDTEKTEYVQVKYCFPDRKGEQIRKTSLKNISGLKISLFDSLQARSQLGDGIAGGTENDENLSTYSKPYAADVILTVFPK